MKRRYSVLLIPDEQDGGFMVRVPSLPGCVTEGDTLEEALANAREAIALYLEDIEAHGEPVPEERSSPLLQAIEV
jgi:predicted RNase H-like HicB family nuclease